MDVTHAMYAELMVYKLQISNFNNLWNIRYTKTLWLHNRRKFDLFHARICIFFLNILKSQFTIVCTTIVLQDLPNLRTLYFWKWPKKALYSLSFGNGALQNEKNLFRHVTKILLLSHNFFFCQVTTFFRWVTNFFFRARDYSCQATNFFLSLEPYKSKHYDLTEP